MIITNENNKEIKEEMRLMQTILRNKQPERPSFSNTYDGVRFWLNLEEIYNDNTNNNPNTTEDGVVIFWIKLNIP